MQANNLSLDWQHMCTTDNRDDRSVESGGKLAAVFVLEVKENRTTAWISCSWYHLRAIGLCLLTSSSPDAEKGWLRHTISREGPMCVVHFSEELQASASRHFTASGARGQA